MKKRVLYAILGSILTLGAIFCGIKAYQAGHAPKAITSTAPLVSQEQTAIPDETPEEEPVRTQEVAPPPAEEPEQEPEPEPEPEEEPEPYVSPIDFESLQAVNPHIYGWLQIDDTNIDYPILQHPEDDSFYLDHDSDGNRSVNGGIFSEHVYNSADFSDPVTILYGHHKWSGAIFGNLQQYYTDSAFLAEHETFKVYTPTALLEYGVFAAVPFSSAHILYYNDFSDEEVFESFFSNVLAIRDMSARFNEKYAPQPGDKVLILSTCFAGNNTRRFLVMATLLD